MRSIDKIAVLAWVSLSVLVAQAAWAHQASGLQVQIIDADQTGTALPGVTDTGDAHFAASLVHPGPEITSNPMLAVFSDCAQDADITGTPVTNLVAFLRNQAPEPVYNTDWIKPGPRWSLCSQAGAYLVDVGSTETVKFAVDFLRLPGREGMSPLIEAKVYEVSQEDLATYQTAKKLAIHYADLQPSAILPISVNYRVTKDTWSYGSYAEVYGAPPKNKISAPKLAKAYNPVKNTIPVNIESFLAGGKIPTDKNYDNNASLETAYAAVLAQGACVADEVTTCPEPKSPQRQAKLPEGISHAITGMFATKWVADHSLHPGLGFRVDVMTRNSGLLPGQLISLGTAWVQPNGLWVLAVPTTKLFNGGKITVSYRPYNEYIAPQNEDGDYYWVNGGSYEVNSSKPAPISEYVDTDAGVFSGLGELAEAAERVWMRTYWDAGLNPVPASPIKIFFPNTWENCGLGSPWSCASTSGEIWLIAQHAMQAGVVAHELGHQLNNKFWNNKRPAGSGGEHSLTSCHPDALGRPLREGFADFFQVWVGFTDRNLKVNITNSNTANNVSNVAGRWWSPFDIESKADNYVCAHGYENELWVARTFWDLHDSHIDDLDWIQFSHQGGVIAGYLLNAVPSDGDDWDMTIYELLYRGIINSMPVGNYAPAVTNAFINNGTQTGLCPGGGPLLCPGESF
ncbi:MAG: hypothetical protein EPN21_12875 [Methylococcaceae bacterium]|nr:MAG: hypothetical protein EPN21_12875 [Methylococcaceae bacterium]